MNPLRRLALTVALALASCNGLPVVGGLVDASRDAPKDTATDVALDAKPDVSIDTSIDAPDVTDAPDVRTDAPGTCATAMDCAPGTLCDTSTGRCVECLPAMDTCSPERHCDPGSRTCVPGCRSDEGCPGGASDAGVSDGGVTALRCDTNSRTCVACLTDEHCPAGTLCVGNTCVVGCTAARPCPTGQTCCTGACVDPLANTSHCGGCDMRCAVTNGTAACMNGVCAVGACAAPFGNCDGDPTNGCEANTLTSAAHCGACGAMCPARANATAQCAAGRCEFVCAAGFADCDGNAANGCETDLTRDPTRCGACSTACNPPNATAACVAGRCAVAACAAGFGDCDGNPTNGCETDVNTAVSNCGACGAACPARANAFPGCLGGRCVTSCVMGFLDCDGEPANGCEAELRNDPRNCGACGRVCDLPHASSTCAAARCAIAMCDTGFADCNGDPADGCEVNLQSDVSHCGACRNVCTVAGGTPACVAGACGLATCSAGRGDCDRSAANGCEVDLNADPRNCGGCGTACDVPGATAACVSGRCAVGACNAGLADCDGSAANGCETDTRTATTACGGCGMACMLSNATATCAAGRCAVASCNAGFADCDGNAANGCETNLASTVTSCGSCGAACSLSNATPACASARCIVASCNAGFADCDMNPTSGCEVSALTDARNCGSCGRACALANVATAGCAGGACTVVACAAGFADCNGNPADGCEVNTNTSASNCGACGRECPTGVCREGTCQSFGGGFESSDPGCAACFNGNPLASGGCGCPGGFGTNVSLRVINDCRGRGTQHGGNITLCGGPATGDWGGAYQRDDVTAGGLGCRAANPYTGACACPGGASAVTFRTLTDSSRGIIGSAITVCAFASAPRASFGGAYQVDDGVAGGVGCRAANPLTGACSCAPGTSPSPLRVEVDAATGFIGSQIFFCVR